MAFHGIQPMNFSLESCLFAEHSFPASQIQGLLQNNDAVHFVLLDLLKLGEKIDKLGEEKIVFRFLAANEQEYWTRFSSDKRKLEWLGGRFAAKYIAAKALELADPEKIPPPWPDLKIIPDDKGRPFLAFADKKTACRLPDISISHSRTMAAAMAVSRGHCGIDVQKITPRVAKVCDRFCTPDEKQILRASFPLPDREITALTKLWAAKEALRKVSNLHALPGFLELELVKIIADSSENGQGPWKFVLLWKKEKRAVAVALVEDYALALTTSNDTVN